MFRFIYGGSPGIRVFAGIGYKVHHIFKVFGNLGHDFIFGQPHHIVLQTRLQQVGEHLDVVSSRTISFADGGVYISEVLREVILQGELRQ